MTALTLPILYTDRSRCLSHETCPRLRYYEYEWGRGRPIGPGGASHVGGLAPAKQSRAVLFGICYHIGAGYLLEVAKQFEEQNHCMFVGAFDPSCVDQAVALAL